jgi:hypothetical protein
MAELSKEQQSQVVRGICGAITAMAYPDFKQLNKALEVWGYSLSRVEDSIKTEYFKNLSYDEIVLDKNI